jgi:hypothetical protein
MKDLDKLNRIFFIPESVELSAALKIVKRARLGDIDFVFRRKNLDRNFNPDGFIQGKNVFSLYRINFRIKPNPLKLTVQIITGPTAHGSARSNTPLNGSGKKNNFQIQIEQTLYKFYMQFRKSDAGWTECCRLCHRPCRFQSKFKTINFQY